jgi:AcrR family transcriptional regulator
MPVARTIARLRPRKRPLQARAQRTVEVVLKAAAQVFARRGYAGATTNHIAEHAGVSVGSLYEYFPSKDALLVALVEAHIRDGEAVLARSMGEIAGRDVGLVTAVRYMVQAMVDMHGRERDLHRVFFEEAPLPRQVRQAVAAMETRVAAWVEAYLRQSPEVTVRDPTVAAALVVKTVEALTHDLVVHGVGEREPAYVEEIVRIVASYLTSRGALRDSPTS